MLKTLRPILVYGDISLLPLLDLRRRILWAYVSCPVVQLTFELTKSYTDLPSVIKTFDFSIFVANALTAPPYILQCCTTVLFIGHSDRIGERGFHGAFGGEWEFHKLFYALLTFLTPA